MSLGSVRIYTQGEPLPTIERVESKIKLCPHIYENDNNYGGLEYVYGNSPMHWFSFQVSDLNDKGKWELNINQMRKYIELFVSAK